MGLVQPGRTTALEAGGRKFKSCIPYTMKTFGVILKPVGTHNTDPFERNYIMPLTSDDDKSREIQAGLDADKKRIPCPVVLILLILILAAILIVGYFVFSLVGITDYILLFM